MRIIVRVGPITCGENRMTETKISKGLTLVEAIDTVISQWETKRGDDGPDRLTVNAETLIYWLKVALQDIDKEHGSKSTQYGIGVVTLGHIYRHRDDWRAALNEYTRGFEILRRHVSTNHKDQRTCNEDAASTAVNALACTMKLHGATAEQNFFFRAAGDILCKHVDHWKACEFLDWVPEFLTSREQEHAAQQLKEQNGTDYDEWEHWLADTWKTKRWQRFLDLIAPKGGAA